jgi:DNA-binding MarR family transcriptional regulator
MRRSAKQCAESRRCDISFLISYQQADIEPKCIVSQPARKVRAVSYEAIPPEHAVAYLMKNLHHSLRQALDEAFRQKGIDMSFAHFAMLHQLDSEPGVAGAELARRAYVTSQTMNTILRRVERDGDIERRPHPATSRADSWSVTRSGRARLDRAKVVAEAVWTGMLASFSERDRRQLQELLERCIAGLDAQVEDLRSAANSRSTVRRIQRRK